MPKRFTGVYVTLPLSGRPEGGGGIYVGNTYDRRAYSFHSMETFFAIFPQYGKFFAIFSTLWKKFRRVFHAMENFLHTVENRLKTLVFSLLRAVGSGLLSGARRAPCEP